jgi:hypothetical protein
MTFQEIIVEANETRDETYGLRVGSNAKGTDVVLWGSQFKSEQEAETEHARLKRIKAENVARYRSQVEADGEIQYDGHVDEVAQHRAEIAMVQGMLNARLITRDDLED